VTGKDSLAVTVPADGVMDILVENMGRINYGARITDNLKGIIRPVTLGGQTLGGRWQMFRLPMSSQPDVSRQPASYRPGMPVLYQGTFRLKAVGDTFLDMEHWGKGIVFVNGINLGRYWKVGPQQTLFLPGCYLRKGKNEIVIFEQLNDKKQTTVAGVTQPVLDKLVKE
jgi:beta-galactosidase